MALRIGLAWNMCTGNAQKITLGDALVLAFPRKAKDTKVFSTPRKKMTPKGKPTFTSCQLWVVSLNHALYQIPAHELSERLWTERFG